MPRLLVAYLLTVAALVVATTGALAVDQDEPSIQGKTLTEWTKLLKDPVSANRVQAARALQQLGAKASPASAELVKLLKESDFQVRNAAQQALQAIGEDAATALAEASRARTSPRAGTSWAS
jgi:HEAT repeat protein